MISVGGFLGVGPRLVAVPYDKIKFSIEPVAYTGAGASNTGGAKPSTTTGSTATEPKSTSKPNPWYPDHAVSNATKDELQKMPEFKFSTD